MEREERKQEEEEESLGFEGDLVNLGSWRKKNGEGCGRSSFWVLRE